MSGDTVPMNKTIEGAAIKYGTEGGGRDLTGSTKLLDGKHSANKLLKVISIDRSYLFQDWFQHFTDVLNTVSVIFAVLLIIDIVLYFFF